MNDLLDLGASFSRALKAEGRAERTRAIYGQAIKFYAEWLIARGRPATLDQLTRDNIREWLGELLDSKSPGTVKTRYRGLFRFCRWLVDEGELETNPMQGMQPPEPQPKPVPVLTDEELSRLLKVCKGPTFAHARDEAIVRVLLDCGVRVSELCCLTVEGTDLDAEMALVTGKGSRTRAIYFSPRTNAALDRYLRRRAQHRWAHLPALLLTQRGAITPDGVRERLNVLGAAAGIDDLHPHKFRHTWAHDFLMQGGQERDLKRLAGWRSDTMLERYGASAADARARAAHQRLHRGDRV